MVAVHGVGTPSLPVPVTAPIPGCVEGMRWSWCLEGPPGLQILTHRPMGQNSASQLQGPFQDGAARQRAPGHTTVLAGPQPRLLPHAGAQGRAQGDPSSRNNGATPRTRQGHKGQLQARRQHQAPPLRAVDTHHTHEDEPMGCPLTLTKWPLGHKQASPQAATQETTVGGGPAGPLTPPQGGREAILASRCWSSGLRASSTQKDDQLGPHALQPGASLPPR